MIQSQRTEVIKECVNNRAETVTLSIDSGDFWRFAGFTPFDNRFS